MRRPLNATEHRALISWLVIAGSKAAGSKADKSDVDDAYPVDVNDGVNAVRVDKLQSSGTFPTWTKARYTLSGLGWSMSLNIYDGITSDVEIQNDDAFIRAVMLRELTGAKTYY